MCARGSVLPIDLIGKSISRKGGVNVCACMWKGRERERENRYLCVYLCDKWCLLKMWLATNVISAFLFKCVIQTQSPSAETKLRSWLFSSNSFDVSLSLDQSVPGGVSAIDWECIRVTDVQSTDIPQKLKVLHLKRSLQFASPPAHRQQSELPLSFLIVDPSLFRTNISQITLKWAPS